MRIGLSGNPGTRLPACVTVLLALLLLPATSAVAQEAAPVAVTDKTFEAQVLKLKKPVLLMITAGWCGPCRMMVPRISDLIGQRTGTAVVATLDVDHNPKTPTQLHVATIPVLMMYKGGAVAATHVGALSDDKLADWFSQSMASQ